MKNEGMVMFSMKMGNKRILCNELKKYLKEMVTIPDCKLVIQLKNGKYFILDGLITFKVLTDNILLISPSGADDLDDANHVLCLNCDDVSVFEFIGRDADVPVNTL